MRRLAVLSLHTSPLAQPGTGDGGGMNVYVRELSSALARAGVACDVFTRASSDDLPPVLEIEPGFRLHHIAAGPPAPLPKEALMGVVDEFADGVLKSMSVAGAYGGDEDLPFDAVHANYWLSGIAGHTIKHRLDLPLVSTFHTLDRVKAEASPEEVEAHSAPHPGRGRGGDHPVFGHRPGVVLGRGRPDLRALRRRPVAHPHRRSRRRPRLLRPRRPRPGTAGPRPAGTGPAPPLRGPDPAAEGRGRGRRRAGIGGTGPS